MSYALIVDDHPLLGSGIAQFIKARHLMEAVYSVWDSNAALGVIEQHGAPALAIVDFWLATGASVELLTHLRLHCPGTAILVISGGAGGEVQAKAGIWGAQGFIDKQASPEVFTQAIAAVLSGMTWFQASPTDAAVRPAASHDLPTTPAELGLSLRQGQILALVLQGLPNKRIALALSVTESTIKEHITAILQKLSVNNRVEAITKLRGCRLVLK